MNAKGVMETERKLEEYRNDIKAHLELLSYCRTKLPSMEAEYDRLKAIASKEVQESYKEKLIAFREMIPAFEQHLELCRKQLLSSEIHFGRIKDMPSK